MNPETEGRFFNLAAAKDRLRGIGDVTLWALTYNPRLVQYALAGTAIGLGLLGLAFLSEQSAPPDPQIPQLYYYDRARISAVNGIVLNHPILVIALGAIAGGIFSLAIPWINRGLEAFCPELKEPELNKPNSGLPPSGAADRI